MRWRPGLLAVVLAGSAAVVLALASSIATSMADHVRSTATASTLANVEAIVRGYLDPILTERDLALEAIPHPEVSDELARLVSSGEMRRINIWTRDGRAMYSTEPSLVGQRLDIGHELAEALAGTSVGEFGDREEVEYGPESVPGRFLEVYVPIRGSSDGIPIGAFEVYVDARPIDLRVAATEKDVFVITLVAGVALLALLWASFQGASRRLGLQNRRLTDLNEQLNALASDLRHTGARFRSLVQNSSDVVAVLDARLAIRYESDAVARVLGREPAARIAQPFAEDIHPEDTPRFDAFAIGLQAAHGSQQSTEFRLLHADGSWRWVDAVGVNLMTDPAVGGLVLNYRDVTERRALEEQLQHQAFHDPLTGLANRALFADRVSHALSRSRGPGQLAVLFIDLDDFKLVNDSLGHVAGDELLQAVAERIRACLRRQDTAARLGGDEFGILVEDADRAAASEVARRILDALRQSFALGGRQLFVQASIGIAIGNDEHPLSTGSHVATTSAEDLLRNADAAMYTAKALGKGRYEFYEERMHAAALRRLELRERIEASLAAGEFEMHYQPVVDLATEEPVGVEALVRWRQPDGRLMAPCDFIPPAEETGMIVPLGRWILEESVRQAVALRTALPGRRLSMAVNVSSRQIQEPGFLELVAGVLERSALPAADLVLELTESALLDLGDSTSEVISGLKALGVRISLDDFGTGYSSLSHLRRFPIDILKIDQSFVAGIDRDGHNERPLVRSVIRLARSVGLETIAEGIERRDQLMQLRALGAQQGQGFYFAQPMEPAALLRMLREPRRQVS